MSLEYRIGELEHLVNDLQVQNNYHVTTIIKLTESLTLAFKLLSENRELLENNSCAVTEMEERLNNLIGYQRFN